jgi:hypothetical protein
MALKIFGPVNSARTLPDSLRLTQKKNGLSEGEASFEVMGVPGVALAAYLPALGAAHPLSAYVWMESRTITQTPTGLRADCRYAGAEPAMFDVPQYELTIAMQEQPIETHQLFASTLAGTPNAPLNGAIFIDPDTNMIGTSNVKCVFERFAPVLTGGGRNPMGGLESFLAPTVNYRQIYVSDSLPSATGFGEIASSVPGPGFPGSLGARTWLYLGFTYKRRGAPAGGSSIVYEVQKEWMLSGPAGWNTTVYDS